jgi:hypothetical protein
MHRTLRSSKRLGALLIATGLLFGCAQQPEPVGFETPDLDLATLRAETPEGTLHAERADNSFVGEIAESRVIGIAFRSEVGGPPDVDGRRGIVVHLYDGQDPALLLGELDEQGAASLQTTETAYFDASVDLVLEGDVVTGTATYSDEDPIEFVAPAATGIGGVYWAVGDEHWEHRAADWVVLPDGRQWGALCAPIHPWIIWCAMRF